MTTPTQIQQKANVLRACFSCLTLLLTTACFTAITAQSVVTQLSLNRVAKQPVEIKSNYTPQQTDSLLATVPHEVTFVITLTATEGITGFVLELGNAGIGSLNLYNGIIAFDAASYPAGITYVRVGNTVKITFTNLNAPAQVNGSVALQYSNGDVSTKVLN